MRRFWLSLTGGFIVTFGLMGLAYLSFEIGLDRLSRLLFWPNTLLQSLVPCANMGTLDEPFCEGTPLNILALLASLPLGVATYGLLAWLWLGRRNRPAG